MKNHNLKTWSVYFQKVKSGEKTFEERLDDRGYAVGDTLTLQEFNPNKQEYMGDELVKMVTYILREPYARDGHVVMSLADVGSSPMKVTLTKTDVLLYGALLESDMYVDGYGSTEEDGELFHKALMKIYGINEDTAKEEQLEAEKCLKDDLKALVIEMMGTVTEFVQGDTPNG